jgi:hypothetical protein
MAGGARLSLLAAIAAAALAVSCAQRRPPVDLGGAWPTTPRSYEQTTRAWTRHGVLRVELRTIMEVHAVFKSPEWRAAFVERSAKLGKLTPSARAALLEAQRQEASEHHEVHLLVSTSNRRENDLQRGPRSIWRLALIDDRGNEVEPLHIRRDRRPRSVIAAEFPELGDFATAYIVRFPRDIDLLRPDAQRFSLTMASARGGVELVWEGAPR